MNKPPTQRSSRVREFIRARFLSGPLLQTKPFGERVLDLGCGWGFYFKINPDARGVDLDDACLAHLCSNGFKVIKGDLLDSLPFNNGYFEWVVCHDVLEHFELNQVETILREVHRVLRPGGALLVLTPNRKGYDFGCRTGAGHRHFITPDEILGLSRQLFVLRCRYTYPLPRTVGQFFTHNKEVVILAKSEESVT